MHSVKKKTDEFSHFKMNGFSTENETKSNQSEKWAKDVFKIYLFIIEG